MEDLAELILLQLKSINQDVGKFVAGVLSNDISDEEQIAFASRLVDLAITIKERVEGTAGLVIEGSVIDVRDPQRDLPSGGG